jgi:hypothetical protein
MIKVTEILIFIYFLVVKRQANKIDLVSFAAVVVWTECLIDLLKFAIFYCLLLMNRLCWKLVYIFRLKAYRRRSWRARSKGTGRRREARWRTSLATSTKCIGEALWWLPMDYDVLYIKGSTALADHSSPRPSPSGHLHPHSLFSSAYIAMHFCFQVCCWVMIYEWMNKEWQAA